MPFRTSWLAVHVVLLVLASTRFTVVTGLGDGRFGWEYFQYTWQSGWGRVYEFPYSLPVVLAFVAAYAAGCGAYFLTWRHGAAVLGAIGCLLCGAGLASFTYELHHWVVDDYRSFIVSPVMVLLALAPLTVIRERQRRDAALRGIIQRYGHAAAAD